MSLRDDPDATDVLLNALANPLAVDQWFDDTPGRFSGVRATLLQELLSRDITFAEVLPTALAIVRVAIIWSPERGWGALLLKAFPGVELEPGVQPPPPTHLDEAQRALLQALVDDQSLWDPINGSASLACMRAGIPKHREEVLDLLSRLR